MVTLQTFDLNPQLSHWATARSITRFMAIMSGINYNMPQGKGRRRGSELWLKKKNKNLWWLWSLEALFQVNVQRDPWTESILEWFYIVEKIKSNKIIIKKINYLYKRRIWEEFVGTLLYSLTSFKDFHDLQLLLDSKLCIQIQMGYSLYKHT